MNIDWKRKLTSRKFWVALTALVSGLVLAFGGSEAEAEQLGGIIMSGAAAVAYIIGEGLADLGTDSSHEKKEGSADRKDGAFD